MREHIHHNLNLEITAAGGIFTLVKEERVRFHSRELLYLVGLASFETACCGTGGCIYAVVPGVILEWKKRIDSQGRAISIVEPLRDSDSQKHVCRLIEETERIDQVVFQ